MKKSIVAGISMLCLSVFFLTGCSNTANDSKENNTNISTSQTDNSNVGNEGKQPESELKGKDFMVTKPMIKVFNGGFERGGSYEMYYNFEGNKFHVDKGNDGRGDWTEVFEYTSNGYKLIDELEQGQKVSEFKEYDVEFPSEIKVGSSWGETGKVTAIDVKVQVPAGTFDAIEVTEINEKEKTKYIKYYSKGIGLIKDNFYADSEDTGFGQELVLLEYDISKAGEKGENLEKIWKEALKE